MELYRQFDVYRTRTGVLVVLVQNDIHDRLRSRVAIPLVTHASFQATIPRLNPTLLIDGVPYALMTQSVATLLETDLGDYVQSVASRRDDIVRAIDLLVTGI